jgi:hypothetical protein
VKLPPFHLRVLGDAAPACRRFGLFLAGSHALQAHGFAGRASQDLDFATACEIPLPWVAAEVAEELRRAGYEVKIIDVTLRKGRMTVADPIGGQAVELDLLREALQDEPLDTELCPVIGLDDAVALKTRALHGRGLPRDFIDVASMAHLYPYRELERLCALHDEEFSVAELLLRLGSIQYHPDEAYEAYGLDADDIRRIRLFALAWADDIRLRRVEDGDSATDFFELDEQDLT